MNYLKLSIYFGKEMLHLLLVVLVFAVLPLAVFTLVTFKSDVLFGFRSFIVMTGSMMPLIDPGAVVYSQTRSSYNVGDIVTFEKEKVLVTHRVVDIQRKGAEMVYITRGDANNVVDLQTVSKSQIIGSVQFHFPYVGQFLTYLKTPPGFISIILIPLIGFVLIELWNIKMEWEKEMEKKLYRRMKDQMRFNEPKVLVPINGIAKGVA